MENRTIPTNNLLQRLFRTASVKNFIKHNSAYLKREPLSVYITRLCAERKLVPERVIRSAGIERTYGHKFFNGTRKPSRDKVIQLAFGFSLDVKETQKLLDIAQKVALHPKDSRDAVVLHALHKGYDLDDVQATLADLGLPVFLKED